MSKEEKKAIEWLKNKAQECTSLINSCSYIGNKKAYAKDRTMFKTILSLIQSQQKDLEEYKGILDIWDKRKYRKRYLEERRKEQKGLLYPDADEIYKKYYEQQEEIELLKEQQQYVIDEYENTIDEKQLELEKKDKIIEQLEDIFYNYQLCEYELTDCTYRKCEYIVDDETPPCKECIKQYFEKQVEKE